MHWILLRGLAREQAHWGVFLERLQQRYPQHQFHCIDLPGTGSHRQEASPTTIAGIREHVQKYAADIPAPFGLLGLSMGGMVALDWAQTAPAQVASVVLLNTSTGLSPPWRRMQPAAFRKALAMLMSQGVPGRERGILRLTSNQLVAREVELRWQSIQHERPVRLRVALAQLRAASRYRPACDPPQATGLVLASAADRIVHWHCSRDLARRWGWPLRVHPDAGHDLPLDAPDWILEQFRTVA